MNPDDEAALAAAYAELARATAPCEEPVAAVRRGMRRRRQRRKGLAAVAAAVVVAVVGIGLHPSTEPTPGGSSAAGGATAASPHGALPASVAQSCAVE